MFFRHNKSGELYKRLFDAFNHETQQPHVIYIGMDNGVFFSCDKADFERKFTYESDPQKSVEPREAEEGKPNEE